jgi:hypothetical protein
VWGTVRFLQFVDAHVDLLAVGIGASTSLTDIIANAGTKDQAIAIAGKFICRFAHLQLVLRTIILFFVVASLYRSLGPVLVLSIGSSIIQNNLQRILYMKLSGLDVDEVLFHCHVSMRPINSLFVKLIRRVRESLSYINELDLKTASIVRGAYDQAIHTTMWFNIAVAACAALTSIYIKEKPLSR